MADCKYDPEPSQEVLHPHGIFTEVVNPLVIPQIGNGIIFYKQFHLFYVN